MRVLWVPCFLWILCLWIKVNGMYITNLNDVCLRCLCHVVGCDIGHACTGGYCGPYYLSRLYWIDAGKPTLPYDDPDRKEAFEDCARDFHCSKRAVKGYMAKYGRDCNRDGVTDCFDYMMINFYGGSACAGQLDSTAHGKSWLDKYQQCPFHQEQ